jgi:4-methylaminobutanoate oxidase (formaldehyde-forming)
MCANDVDKPPGAVIYTQMLNARAGIEADLTVTRLDECHYRVVTSTASGVRDLAWLRRHRPTRSTCTTSRVPTAACACGDRPLGRSCNR